MQFRSPCGKSLIPLLSNQNKGGPGVEEGDGSVGVWMLAGCTLESSSVQGRLLPVPRVTVGTVPVPSLGM